MISEDERERMHQSYLDKKSLRQIAREERSSRETVKKAVFDTPKVIPSYPTTTCLCVWSTISSSRCDLYVCNKKVCDSLVERVCSVKNVRWLTYDGNGVHF